MPAETESSSLRAKEGRRRERKRREPSRSRWVSPRADLAIGVLLALVVIGSVLALGAVHLPVLLAVSALALGAACIALRGGGRWPLPALVCAVLAAYTALQATPLPVRLVSFVAPLNAEIWTRALVLLRETRPTWIAVSLDPGATWIEALKWATYALVFVAATAFAQRRGALWGLGLVFTASVTAALVTVGHGLLGANKVYGLYEPLFAPAAWHLGPLINPNNLSGYLTLGTLTGLGLLLTRRAGVPVWIVGLGVATNVGVSVTAASRAGAMALPIGVLILGVAVERRRRGGDDEGAVNVRVARWLVAGAVGGGLALALLGATTETWKELWDQNFEKLSAIRWVAQLIRAHPGVGVGRGAFESVFPAHRNAPGNLVFTHAENFPADWAAGWGVPVALAALVVFAWALRRRAVGAHRSIAAAAGWAGIIALLAQNLADLGLEVPALPIALATVWGSLLGQRANESKPVRDTAAPSRFRARLRVGLAMAVTLSLGAVAMARGRTDLTLMRRSLQQRLVTESASTDQRAALRAELRSAIRNHPAEPYFPLVGALLAWQARDDDPMRWLSWALERDLTNGRAHLLAAEIVASRGSKSQALLELRLALDDDQALANPAARLALRWRPTCDELLELAPAGERGAAVLCTLATLTPSTLAGCRERLVAVALERAPRQAWPRAIAASDLLQRLRNREHDSVCAGERRADCEAEIEQHARAIEIAEPKSSSALQIRAQALRFTGRPEKGERLLRENCRAFDGREGCLRARVDIASDMQPSAVLVPAIRDYVSAACVSAAACANASTSMGDLLASRGEVGTAAIYYERAAREHPTEARWLSLADTASRSGAHSQAAAALEKVAQLRGSADPALRQRIDAERGKALGLP